MINDVTGGTYVIDYPSTYLVDIHKYHASQFYNWEQDNIPIDDLEARTDTLGAALGIFASGIDGCTMTLANTEVSANSVYGSIDNIIKLIPKTITFPILVEVCSYGNLGDLILENITLKGRGKLEFINRNYSTSIKGDTNAATVKATATMTAFTGTPFPWGDEVVTSSVTSQKLLTEITAAKAFNLRTTNNCYDRTEWNKYFKVISHRDLSTNLTMSEPMFGVSSIYHSELISTTTAADYGFSAVPYTDISTSADSRPTEFSISGQTSFRGPVYRTPPAVGQFASPTYAYANWFNKVKVENCRGSQIQIKGFCVDGAALSATNGFEYHANAVGFDIQNSDVVLTSCAAVRNSDVGFRIDNSNVLIEGGITGYRNYPYDGSSRTPIPGETEYDIWNLDYKGHGFEAYRSHISFDPDSTDDNAVLTSNLGKHGFVMSNNGGDGWRFDNCRISGGVGGHNATAEQGAGPLDYQTTQLIGAFNNSNGISLIDSNSEYRGILRAQGNMVHGISASKSKVSCMGVVSELNNEIGLRLKSSEFIYNYGAANYITAYDSNNINWKNRAGHSLLTPAISVQDNGIQNIKIFNNSTFENEHIEFQSRRSGLVGGRGKPTNSWAMQAANSRGGETISISSREKFNLPLISVDHNSYARFLGLSVFGDINPLNANNTLYAIEASAGVKGRALSITDNSHVDLYGTSAYCTVLTNEHDYGNVSSLMNSWNKSAVYVGNSSKVRISGPTKISQFGVAVLAENNSTIEVGPPLDSAGVYDSGLYDFENLSDGNGHTKFDAQSTRACLVVNNNSTLDMNKCGVGVSANTWTTNRTAHNAVDDIYHASSYVQLYPNGFTEEAYDHEGGRYCDQNWRRYLQTPGAFNRLTMGLDSSTAPSNESHVSATTGGMCVRALGSSNVLLDQVNFEVYLGCTDTSGAYYNIDGSANEGVGLYHGSAQGSAAMTEESMLGTALEHYGGSQIHMWNIADTSRIVASNLKINKLDGSAAGYYGPCGQWGTGSAYNYNLGPLDYYGTAGVYIQTYTTESYQASASNFGPFRLLLSVNSDLHSYFEGTASGGAALEASGYLDTLNAGQVEFGHSSDGPRGRGGSPIAQLNAQGYAAAGLFAQPLEGSDYRRHWKIEGQRGAYPQTGDGTVQPIFGGRQYDGSGVTVGRIMLAQPMMTKYDSYIPYGVTRSIKTDVHLASNFPIPPIHMDWQGYLRNFLDESASDVFANSKHAASKLIKLCSIYRSNTNPTMGGEGRDGADAYTFGKGCRSLNLFDLDKLI